LAAARVAVEAGDHAAAEAALQWAIEHADQQTVRVTAKLRLARLYLGYDHLNEAAKLINENYPLAYSGAVQELLGDLAVRRGDAEQARVAYQNALAAEVSPLNRQMIQIKLDELSLPGQQEPAESADA